jgi:hypothetical protein
MMIIIIISRKPLNCCEVRNDDVGNEDKAGYPLIVYATYPQYNKKRDLKRKWLGQG